MEEHGIELNELNRGIGRETLREKMSVIITERGNEKRE